MDILIKNAAIIDGTGKKAYKGNVGVDNGKIVLSNLPETANMVIDAVGKYVTPGFIDSHSHGDMVVGRPYGDLCKLNQGVTTQIAGQCGNTMAPISTKYYDYEMNYISGITDYIPEGLPTWFNWSDYADYTDSLSLACNIKCFVGYNTIRIAVMGYEDRKPTEEEFDKMKALLKNAMENGALGMSSGLAYVPGTFTTTDEIAEVAKVMVPYGGIYTTHMRNESFDLVASVEEAIEVGRKAGVPVNISHFKAMGRDNWGTPGKAIEVIEKARAEGMQVTVDQYPYNCSMTHLYPCMPPWYFTDGMDKMLETIKDPAMRLKIKAEMEDPNTQYDNLYRNAGGWGGITVCATKNTGDAEGMTVRDYAAKLGKDEYDCFFDLLLDNDAIVTAVYHSIGDDDIYDIIRLPYAVVGSDGLVRSLTEKCHPRGWGSMVRAICAFTKDKHILTLEEMIHKITALPAEIYSLENKGVIAEGYDADLVIMDYDNLVDKATYNEPTELAQGIDYVLVNGQVVYTMGKLTGVNSAKFLRHHV